MSNLSFEDAINNLSNDDVSIRKEAVESLVGITDEKAIEPLIKATTDENAQVRFKAAEILGNMGDVAVDKLIEEFDNAEGKNKRFLAFALKETEDKIAITRQFYNDTVTSYNTLLQLFPNVIFANMFGFHDEKLFKSKGRNRYHKGTQYNYWLV